MPCNQASLGQPMPSTAMEPNRFKFGAKEIKREQNRAQHSALHDRLIAPPHGLTNGSNGMRLLSAEETRFDPYQVFEVERKPCLLLTATVKCGRKITKGWVADFLDTPDPYVELRIRTAPDGKRRTSAIDNQPNPVWNEEFVFLLDQSENNIIHISLMEANIVKDTTIGSCYFDVRNLVMNKSIMKTFIFNEVSEVDIQFKLELDLEPTLRYSLCLCPEEKDFRSERTIQTMAAMKRLLGSEGPRNTSEVPNVAVIGSGGGFRAMVGMSGVIKALSDTGVLDCTTYAAGLSGSSWYLSTLYSHPKWPDISHEELQREIKNSIDSSLLWLLKPQSVCRYVDRIMEKRRQGQPVSFTDIFGHLVGETLLKGLYHGVPAQWVEETTLYVTVNIKHETGQNTWTPQHMLQDINKDRMDSKLTDQQDKIKNGDVPMPLYTCVHVKKDVSARSFQEWVEFTPFEIGMPKYGTYMKSELFGSKFFMGKLCKQFEEQPLHFLQGIWGSAFCILFNRLLEDNRKLDPVEMIRQEMEKQLDEVDCSRYCDNDSDDDVADDTDDGPSPAKRERVDCKGKAPIKQRHKSGPKTEKEGYWSNMFKGLVDSKRYELLSTRAGRAGVVHNFMRGLSLQQSYPLSPFSPAVQATGTSDFHGTFEQYPTNIKRLYMVDAGLTFNSPYPLVLRPQRGVDLILSFDFSARPSDSSQPFKELLLAEKWAGINRLPFPPIDKSVFEKEGMKELYIFRHPTDPSCPIVLHFVLVNLDFRKYKKPGVLRKTSKEKSFADFSLFNDPKTPYSTFNFTYSHQAFDRLAKLTEFNTLNHIQDIKDAMAESIRRRRDLPLRFPISSKKVKLLRIKSRDNLRKLTDYLEKIENQCSPRLPPTEGFCANLPSMDEQDIESEDDGRNDVPTFVGPASSTRRSLRTAAKRK